MNLLQEINQNVDQQNQEVAIIESNFDVLVEHINDFDSQLLTEAVTHWIANLRSAVRGGKLDPSKKKSVAYILAALMALSNPDFAAAFDERGDLGTLLSRVRNEEGNKQDSNAALAKLRDIGQHPSNRGFVAKAEEALDNPDLADKLTTAVQQKIDKVMRQKLAGQKAQPKPQPQPQM